MGEGGGGGGSPLLHAPPSRLPPPPPGRAVGRPRSIPLESNLCPRHHKFGSTGLDRGRERVPPPPPPLPSRRRRRRPLTAAARRAPPADAGARFLSNSTRPTLPSFTFYPPAQRGNPLGLGSGSPGARQAGAPRPPAGRQRRPGGGPRCPTHAHAPCRRPLAANRSKKAITWLWPPGRGRRRHQRGGREGGRHRSDRSRPRLTCDLDPAVTVADLDQGQVSLPGQLSPGAY